MINRAIRTVKQQVDRHLLPYVRKPARYIGGEMNQIVKDLSRCRVRVALAFPDVYEVASSYTGLSILYEIVNHQPDWAAERLFAPWVDAEAVMRQKGIPLFTLESCAVAADFDWLGFSLTNELCYTNFLNMLDLAGLAIRSDQRAETDPIIAIGGQAAHSAEPLAPFVDLVVIGEGEEALPALLRLYEHHQSSGWNKRAFLLDAARQFSFVYVPAFYQPDEDNPRRAHYLKPRQDDLRVEFDTAVVADFENAPAPTAPIVPFVQPVHERISIEIMRGCPGRCRFCQASFCRRPIRYRSPQRIVELAEAQYAATGYDTIGLLSLSTADYPYLDELLERLEAIFAPRSVGVSVPSLKVQTQLALLPKKICAVRKSGLTIAVEAASEKLRQLINKPITDADLFAAVKAAYQAGFQKVKLYFMVGFPAETEGDILAIVDLSVAIAHLRKEIAGRPAQVNAAVSWLVPKPHTPMAFFGQRSATYFHRAKQMILQRKAELKCRTVQFKFHDIDRSVLEAAIGRGDRRLAEVIELAWRRGARFDLWDETFDIGIWRQAFADCGLSLDDCAQTSFSPDGITPWGHLGGPDLKTLLRHWQQIKTEYATHPDT